MGPVEDAEVGTVLVGTAVAAAGAEVSVAVGAMMSCDASRRLGWIGMDAALSELRCAYIFIDSGALAGDMYPLLSRQL